MLRSLHRLPRRAAIVALALVPIAAARHQDDVLLPGDAMLQPPPFASSTTQWAVFVRRPSDGAEIRYSTVTRTERPLADGAVLLTSEWAPPADSRDSLTMQRVGLVPVAERLDFRGATRRYRYEGAQVTGSVQAGDSASVPYARTFERRVFAFNQVEALVRSVPYRVGFHAVVPLFSEVDKALEHDTIDVLRRGAPAGGDSTWIVRFADPAITSEYTVDGAARAIRETRTTNRRSGTLFRYVPQR